MTATISLTGVAQVAGQTQVEYALLLLLVVLAAIVAVGLLGEQLAVLFSRIVASVVG